jgi:starch phosphorylase
VLAGDFIKSAHDLKLPVVAVTLRWERGYGVQRIGADGMPTQEFPGYEHGFLTETSVRVRVRVRGQEIPCRVWMTQRFGHVPLYLIEPYRVQDRWITHRLYEAGTDVRIAQEMLLGIGGVRALNWLGIPISTFHFNEGHAVFAGVEMIAERMEETGQSFPGGVGRGAEAHRVHDAHAGESGQRGALAARSPAHGCVPPAVGRRDARHRRRSVQHDGGRAAARAARERGVRAARPHRATDVGADRQRGADHARHERRAPADVAITTCSRGCERRPRLWDAHVAHKRELLEEVEKRSGVAIPPSTLLIGFARRAATYKRGDLILRDPERLDALMATPAVRAAVRRQGARRGPHGQRGRRGDRARPGAVPRSRAVPRELRHGARATARRGCDVWLNNPIRPLEASGTSGMKAAMNGL